MYPYTQWFCWSLSLLNGYFIGGIPHFQTYPIRLHCSLGVLFKPSPCQVPCHSWEEQRCQGATDSTKGEVLYGRSCRYEPNHGKQSTCIILKYDTVSISISHYLTLSHTISHYLTLSHTISHYLTLSHTISHYLTLPRPLQIDFVLFSVARTEEQLRFIDTSLSRCYGALPGATPSQRTRP